MHCFIFSFLCPGFICRFSPSWVHLWYHFIFPRRALARYFRGGWLQQPGMPSTQSWTMAAIAQAPSKRHRKQQAYHIQGTTATLFWTPKRGPTNVVFLVVPAFRFSTRRRVQAPWSKQASVTFFDAAVLRQLDTQPPSQRELFVKMRSCLQESAWRPNKKDTGTGKHAEAHCVTCWRKPSLESAPAPKTPLSFPPKWRFVTCRMSLMDFWPQSGCGTQNHSD